jgi:lysophospholipase
MQGVARRRTAPAGGTFDALVAADGTRLRTARWPRDGAPLAVLVGGRGEFIEKHFETVADLVDRGFAVATMDWRGQGLSDRALPDRRKGHVADFAAYESDLALLVEREAPRGPVVLIGHSMGGHLVLRAAANRPGLCTRVVAVAPMIEIDFGRLGPRFPRLAARAAMAVGRSAAYVFGGAASDPVAMPFEGNPLTSDPGRFADMIEAIRSDPDLAVHGPTWGWLSAALASMDTLAASARRIAVPALLVAAGSDTVVVPAAIRRLAASMPHATLLDIPEARHEVLKERDEIRARFWAELDAFLAGIALEPAC